MRNYRCRSSATARKRLMSTRIFLVTGLTSRIPPKGTPEQLSGGDFTPAPGDLWPHGQGAHGGRRARTSQGLTDRHGLTADRTGGTIHAGQGHVAQVSSASGHEMPAGAEAASARRRKPDLTPEEAKISRLAKLFDLRSFIGRP